MIDVNKRQQWMTDDQWACAQLLAQVLVGRSLIDGAIEPCGIGIKIITSRGFLSGLDIDLMTTLAVRGVAARIRPEIGGDASGRVALSLFPYAPTTPSLPQPMKKKGKAKKEDVSPALSLDFGDN